MHLWNVIGAFEPDDRTQAKRLGVALALLITVGLVHTGHADPRTAALRAAEDARTAALEQQNDRTAQRMRRASLPQHSAAEQARFPDASTPDPYPPHVARWQPLPKPYQRVLPRIPFADTTDLTPQEYYDANVSPIVQGKCVACHVEGGASGNTRLVFGRGEDAKTQAANYDVFVGFLDEVDDGAALILNKVQGVAHGGGAQTPAGSAEYAHIEKFLGLLGEELAAAAVTVETLFDTVQTVSPRTHPAPRRHRLRRAQPHSGGTEGAAHQEVDNPPS